MIVRRKLAKAMLSAGKDRQPPDEIVRRALKLVMVMLAERKPGVRCSLSYGKSARYLNHLIIWYVFRSDADLETARNTGFTSDVEQLTKDSLAGGCYPLKEMAKMIITFTSGEDIHRKTERNY